MNCYHHQDTVSVGVCRHCFRGVCSACAVSFDDGLACRGKCEEKAKQLVIYLQKSIKSAESYQKIYASSSKTLLASSLFFISIGLVYMALPWFYGRDDGGWSYIVGGIFLSFGIAVALRGRELKPIYDELGRKDN